MDISKFKISGFARFYRSLLRYYYDLDSAYALNMTYTLYTAVIETYQFKYSNNELTAIIESEFYEKIKHKEVRPYRTEIQLYRAMEAILYCIDIPKAKSTQMLMILDLTRLMDNTELRFYRAFNMEIDDKRTVYSKCLRSLVPAADEPGLCLIDDWLETLEDKS